MKFQFAHNNFNVLDLEKSLKFYDEALGFKPAEASRAVALVLEDGLSSEELIRRALKGMA